MTMHRAVAVLVSCSASAADYGKPIDCTRLQIPTRV